MSGKDVQGFEHLFEAYVNDMSEGMLRYGFPRASLSLRTLETSFDFRSCSLFVNLDIFEWDCAAADVALKHILENKGFNFTFSLLIRDFFDRFTPIPSDGICPFLSTLCGLHSHRGEAELHSSPAFLKAQQIAGPVPQADGLGNHTRHLNRINLPVSVLIK
jgi:hypothetical protein